MPLTQIAITKLKPGANRIEKPDGHGLYFVLQTSGGRSWALRYKHPGDGRSRKLTLGPFRELGPGEGEPADAPTVGSPLTLKQARALAAAKLREVALGQDPAAAKQSAKRAEIERGDADHFDVAARRYLLRYAKPRQRASTYEDGLALLGFTQAQDGKLEPRSRDAARKTRPLATWPATAWAGRALQSISKRDVISLLDGVVDAGSPHAANGTQLALSGFFNWAVAEDLLQVSPIQGVRKRTPLVKRDRVLSDAELRLVLLGADALGRPFGPLVRLLALTGCRRDELAGSRWSEFDLQAGVFHLPKERSKNHVALDLPLSPQALDVLADLAEHRLKGEGDWLFSTGQGRARAAKDAPLVPISGFSKIKARLDRLVLDIQQREAEAAGLDPASVQPMPDWRLHDLRRTAVTNMARLGVPFEHREACVNHAVQGVSAVYQHHDWAAEMRDAMRRLGEAVERVSQGEPLLPSNVIELKAAAG